MTTKMHGAKRLYHTVLRPSFAFESHNSLGDAEFKVFSLSSRSPFWILDCTLTASSDTLTLFSLHSGFGRLNNLIRVEGILLSLGDGVTQVSGQIHYNFFEMLILFSVLVLNLLGSIVLTSMAHELFFYPMLIFGLLCVSAWFMSFHRQYLIKLIYKTLALND